MMQNGFSARGGVLAAFILMLATLPAAGASAPPPPRPGCVAVSKLEYNSAAKSRAQQNRFGHYETTRKLLRRAYWFCPL
jgi:hypothetical protein